MAGASCRACGDVEPGTPAWGDGEFCPGGGRSVLQGLWGRRTGHTGLGGWGAQPRGWREFSAGPAGMDNQAHRPGGTGSPAQGVVGVSCRACGDVEPSTPAWGDGEPAQGVVGVSCRPAGMDNRAHRLGGMGSPAQGVVGVSCRDCGEVDSGTPALGDGESCPGVGLSVLLGLWGGSFGHTAPGGRGVLPRGWSECPAGPVRT